MGLNALNLLPSPRFSRSAVIALVLAGWLFVLSLLLSSLHHPDGVRGVAQYVADSSQALLDQVKPGPDDETRAKLARLEKLEQESKLYITNHARCSAHTSALLEMLDERWGRTALDMSVGYEGSGVRVRAVARKLSQGEKVVITTLGGSITAGHSMEEGGKAWPVLLGEMLRQAFPESDVQLANNAIGATGSDYFNSCYQHHTENATDLFLFEFAVNDAIIEMAAKHELDTIWHSEHLIRSIMHNHKDAAMIFMSTWQKPQHYMTGADAHATVSEYYDIPRISSRTFLYPYMLQHRNEIPDHYVDRDNFSHQNQKGQQYMADIMFRYLIHQVCRVESDTTTGFAELLTRPNDGVQKPIPGFAGSQLPSEFDPWKYPYLRVRQMIDSQEYLPDATPFCSSVRVRVDGDKPQLRPSRNEGFEEFEANDKWFWKSEQAGATITFPDITVVDGTVSLYFLRSWGHDMGDLRCWVNDDEDRAALLSGFWGFVSVGARALIAKDLKAGVYSVTCRSVQGELHDGNPGGNRTQIIAVMAT